MYLCTVYSLYMSLYVYIFVETIYIYTYTYTLAGQRGKSIMNRRHDFLLLGRGRFREL